MSEESQANQPGNEDKHTQGIDRKTGQAEPHNPTPNPPTTANFNPTPTAGEHRDDKNKCKYEVIKEVFEWVAIIAAIGLFIITYLQLRDSQQTRILDERAWVSVVEAVIESSQQTPNLTDFKVNFRNTGKTPAINVVSWINESKGLVPATKTDTRPNPAPFSGMVAPDAIASINTADRPITDEETRAISNGIPYYVYGTIWYDDIFGGHHWSQFCYQVKLTPYLEFLPTKDHNSCDDAETSQKK